MASKRKIDQWRPESLDVIETMFLLTGVRPSRLSELRPMSEEIRGRLDFERALSETDFEGAERIITRMALRTHALVWCYNASRRLAHRKRRAKDANPGDRR